MHRKCFIVISISDSKPEVIYEAYRFSIKDSCKPLDESKTESPDDLTTSGRRRSSTILLDCSGRNAKQLRLSKIDNHKSKVKERNTQIQNMIAEVFEKMNEFAQKRDVSYLSPINYRIFWALNDFFRGFRQII